MRDNQRPTTYDRCKEWVAERIFPLRQSGACHKNPEWPGMVGLELEMIAFRLKDSSTIPKELIPLFGSTSSSSYLIDLSTTRPGWNSVHFDDDKSKPLEKIVLDNKDQITFEPGGQIELSTTPFFCLKDALSRVEELQRYLDNHFASNKATLFQFGMNPWLTVDEIGLQMNKARYKAMDSHFQKIGSYGRRMMRQTCTIQVNLDFGNSESTMAKRYLLANLLAPFGTAIFANSPVSDNSLNGYHSFRGKIWQELDPSRTGFHDLKGIAKDLNKQSCIDAYTEHLLAAQVIFIQSKNYMVPQNSISFNDLLRGAYDNYQPSFDDFLTHLSLHFTEVRPRGFIELRSVDCQSRVWQSVPALFYTSLLYDPISADKALDLLTPYIECPEKLLKLASNGLQDNIVKELSQKLMELAADGFDRLPTCYTSDSSRQIFDAYNKHFTAQGRTPADDIISVINDSANNSLTPLVLWKLEDKWRRLQEMV
jgi:glutamate--cysteine ligase